MRFNTKYQRSAAAVTLLYDLKDRILSKKKVTDCVDVITAATTLIAAPVEIRKASERIIGEMVDAAERRRTGA